MWHWSSGLSFLGQPPPGQVRAPQPHHCTKTPINTYACHKTNPLVMTCSLLTTPSWRMESLSGPSLSLSTGPGIQETLMTEWIKEHMTLSGRCVYFQKLEQIQHCPMETGAQWRLVPSGDWITTSFTLPDCHTLVLYHGPQIPHNPLICKSITFSIRTLIYCG